MLLVQTQAIELGWATETDFLAWEEEARRDVDAAQATGKVPAYLTNQIANYQAALDRLGGGG